MTNTDAPDPTVERRSRRLRWLLTAVAGLLAVWLIASVLISVMLGLIGGEPVDPFRQPPSTPQGAIGHEP